MDSQTKSELFQMYRNYKHELWEYTGENYEDQLEGWFEDMLKPPMTLKPIKHAARNTIIGFFITQELDKEQQAESGCKWYISEAYIMPSYRHQGFMTAIVHDFISWHKGNIGLVTINSNVKATKFWDDTLLSMGYSKECIPHLGGKTESFYRFKAPVMAMAK